jgi:hypothetical protein
MPVSGTSVDYSGRLVDMYISGTLNPLSTATQNITYSFGYPTQYIAGVQKLIQRYIISLINSGFVEDLIGLSSNNIQTAKNLFNNYNAIVIQNFKSYQNSQTPSLFLDEQLSTVQLNNVTSTGTYVNYSMTLTTQAGTTVTVLLPLPL